MSWQVTIPMFLSKISIIELRYPQKGPDLKNPGKKSCQPRQTNDFTKSQSILLEVLSFRHT